RSLSAFEPARRTDTDVAFLATRLGMRVRLIDQVERDARIVARSIVNGSRELSPEVGKVVRRESLIVVDDVGIARSGVVLPRAEGNVDASGQESFHEPSKIRPIVRVTRMSRGNIAAETGLHGLPRKQYARRANALGSIPIQKRIGI